MRNGKLPMTGDVKFLLNIKKKNNSIRIQKCCSLGMGKFRE
jgi:hypothetical protein